jgi:transposase-like protein
MEEEQKRVISLSTEVGLTEERMLGQELVREMIARRERGDGIKQIARELGVDRKPVKRWLRLGEWQPRRPQRRARQQDRFAEFIERRAREVGFNGVVLHRELKALVLYRRLDASAAICPAVPRSASGVGARDGAL